MSTAVPQLKVTMLGAEHSGKSTFMLGMYNIMRAGVSDYFLHTRERNDDLELKRKWQALRNPQERAWLPPNNHDVQFYDFNFLRDGQRIIDIRWIDYRGNALASPEDHANPDVAQLLRYVRESHCLFLVIDGEKMAEPLDGRILDVQDSTLSVEIQQLLLRLERPLPIGILITKADLCRPRHADGSRVMNMLVDEVKQLFKHPFREGQKFKVMVCPVTLGLDLQKDAMHGTIRPALVHLPLIFAIQSLFEVESGRRRGEIQSARSREDRIGGELDALENSFFSFFRGGKIQETRDQLESAGEERKRAEDAARHAEKHARELAGELDQVALFYDGKRIQPPPREGA